MEQFVLPVLLTLFTALITWFFSRRKTTAEAKSAEIDNEVKTAEFYERLLSYSKNRLDELLAVIDQQNQRLAERDKIIAGLDLEKKEQQKRISELIEEIEMLTVELRKYKQLKV